jgi:nucleoside-diphosphate-sugar epimerase
MTVVITGASGNVGTALRQVLSERGIDWVGVCRRPPEAGPEWVSLDLTEPAAVPRLAAVFAGATAVVHLAWVIQPVRDEAFMHRVNVDGTRNVLEAIGRAEVPHLVHASSLGAYGPGTGPVTEQWPVTGIATSAYSRQKVAAERMIDSWSATRPNQLVTRLRPTLIGQAAAAAEIAEYFLGGWLPPAVIRTARRGLPVLAIPRGLRLQFVHAVDVATAAVEAIERRAGGAFNLAAEPLDAAGLARLLDARAVELPARLVRPVVNALYRAHVIPVSVGWYDLALRGPLLDSTRAREVLDWRPTRTSAEVGRELVDALSVGQSGPTPALQQ